MRREHVKTIHGNLVYKDTCYIQWEYTFTYTREGATYTNTYKSLIAPEIIDGKITEGGLQCSRPYHNCKIIGVTKYRLCTTGGVTVELYN
tara:strand:+ start:1736 stop:2005 length:270 start_codon:yes stop_codon:yes gene_type:complete